MYADVWNSLMECKTTTINTVYVRRGGGIDEVSRLWPPLLSDLTMPVTEEGVSCSYGIDQDTLILGIQNWRCLCDQLCE